MGNKTNIHTLVLDAYIHKPHVNHVPAHISLTIYKLLNECSADLAAKLSFTSWVCESCTASSPLARGNLNVHKNMKGIW